MTTYPRWKYILVLLVLTLSIVYSLPNFYPSYPSIEIRLDDNDGKLSAIIENNESIISSSTQDGKTILRFSSIDDQLKTYNIIDNLDISGDYTLLTDTQIPNWLKSINASPMFLGLDLKGGVHFLLQVDEDNIKSNLLRETESDIKKLFIKNKLRFSDFQRNLDNITFNFSDTEKLNQANSNSVIPILCIGESVEENKKNETYDVLEIQINEAFKGIDELSSLIIAYEPVWAIGSGKIPDPVEINSIHKMIKDVVQSRFPKVGLNLVLYGGSVNSKNASSLFSQENIDGALVGGASLSGKEFALIANVLNELS